MYRFLLSWRWLRLGVLALVLSVSFGWLGAWQLSRFEASRSQTGAASLAQLSPAGEPFPEEQVNRIVEVEGRYDAAGQRLVAGRPRGGIDGYLVITPLVDVAGGVVLVNRGWVRTPADPEATVPPGDRTVTGTLQAAETSADSAVGDAPLEPGQDPYIGATPLADVPEFSRFPGWISIMSEDPPADVAPDPLPTSGLGERQGGRGLNLGYALQWWVFAAAVIFFAVRMAQLEARERRAAEEGAATSARERVAHMTAPDQSTVARAADQSSATPETSTTL